MTLLIDWAKDEGWNPGVSDIDAFWATDPKGFFGCYLEEELIAGGSIVSYGGNFGFMGLFIVKPKYRDQGIGNRLWYLRRDILLDRLNDGASIGMDGVVPMQSFYEKGGFRIVFRDERYQRVGEAFAIHSAVAGIEPAEWHKISGYDRLCFGFNRLSFLKEWLKMPESKAFSYTVRGEVKGYAVLRKAQTGFKIGPLFADEPSVGEELYKACLNAAQGAPTFIDIPVTNAAAVDLVNRYKAQYVFECARMYYGKAPDIDMNRVYGITTFELG